MGSFGRGALRASVAGLVWLLVCSLVVSDPAEAKGGRVHVRGYVRKDGTYVQPHYRSAPDGNPYNNWSYPGNVNPVTGKVATGDPDTYLNNYYNRKAALPIPRASEAVERFLGNPSTSYYPPGVPDASVIELQRFLKDSGFDPGPIDGIYGARTARAFQALVAARHMPKESPTGEVNYSPNPNPYEGASLKAPSSTLKKVEELLK